MDESAIDHETVADATLVTRPGRPGDRVTKVARLEGARGRSRYVVLGGTVEREQTLAGEEVLVEGVDTVVEIGAADDLDRLLRGIERIRGD